MRRGAFLSKESSNMKKILAASLLAVASVAAQAQDKLPVVASFSILGDLVTQIGGDRVSVRALVGPDGDAHVFQPSPQDAAVVASARLLVINGLGFEGWIERLTGTSRFAGITTIASDRVKAIEVEAHDGHGHGKESAGKPAAPEAPGAHSHAHGAHGDHHHGPQDPHAWQDPRRVKTYVANIVAGLSKADPAGAAYFTSRAADYVAKLDALDAWIDAEIAAVPESKRKVITSHDAFGYYENRYRVEFVSVSGVSTDAEAAAGDVASIIRLARKEGIKAIFVESISNARMIEQVAREANAKVGARLYSDALSAASGPAGDYLTMMRYNTEQLVKGMKLN
jgi:zinc/manganese transport system substrate-binding protein